MCELRARPALGRDAKELQAAEVWRVDDRIAIRPDCPARAQDRTYGPPSSETQVQNLELPVREVAEGCAGGRPERADGTFGAGDARCRQAVEAAHPDGRSTERIPRHECEPFPVS